MAEKFFFEKQETRFLKDTVYKTMVDAIKSGKLGPGTRLLETDLAEQMGISRGPIRQALKRLMQDGYIYQHPGVGLIVTDLKPEERDRVFVPIRRIIECYAAVCAAKTFTEEDYAAASALIAKIAAACAEGNLSEMTAYDFDFHNYIVSRCASMMLMSIWESVAARIKLRIMEWTATLSSLDNVVSEHEEQLDAIRSGDEARIERVFSKYIF
ncbi:MAG: GntR family transcriptional regulator [Oscillospiraceae bacterium]